MNLASRLCILLLIGGPLCAENGPNSKTLPENLTVDGMLPNQKAFLNLTQEQRSAFIEQFQEANRLFSQKRIFEALEKAHEAERLFPDSPEVFNLKGSCYVEMRAFDKAMDAFNKAASLTTQSSSIQFNIGEVYFVTKQWQKAAQTFEALMKQLPTQDLQLSRLSQFKIMLCKIRLGQMSDARILANKYDYLDDSPYYYFAEAALAYEQGQLIEAEQWLARANRIFRTETILAPWHDTLVEFGYIKSFYGGEE